MPPQLDSFAQLIILLAGMADRFATTLDCGLRRHWLPADRVLDKLPLPAQTRTGMIAGVDLNKPRIRAALSAAVALAPAPGGFTAAGHAPRVRTMAGHDGYTTRQAAYDLLGRRAMVGILDEYLASKGKRPDRFQRQLRPLFSCSRGPGILWYSNRWP